MPADAPLYGPPPYAYGDARIASFVYLTDPAAAARVVPSALQIVEPATATVVIGAYGDSPFGPYTEAMQLVVCLSGQTTLLYVVRMIVTNIPAMAAGREIWGFPKQFGGVTLTDESGIVSGTVTSAAGAALCSARLTVGTSIDPACAPNKVSIVSGGSV